LQFNFSHSRNLAVIATTPLGNIGVDIETTPTIETCREVSSRVLSAKALQDYGSLPDEEFIQVFLRQWTMKEAILKATGEGLSREMVEIEFSSMNPSPELSRLPEGYGIPDNWHLQFITVSEHGCLIAVAHNEITT
jgi:4'-phosphopantetheinyl transferase